MRTKKLNCLRVLGCVTFVALTCAIQAQSDVTQPGDALIASSSNSPGSEGVANAIDNTQAKYLNFDADTDLGSLPTGFIVTPSVGATRVTGISIQSANDAPERDPNLVRLEGSNDSAVSTWTGGTWEVIVETNFQAFAARFETQTILFPNLNPYRHYRLTFLTVQTPNSCCMQVADVELLGSALPSDVTQPGDALIASSSNSPGSEGVANAIDNTQAKYLNFDADTDLGSLPTGFIVTPSVGKTLVTGMTFQSANDAPERDPLVVTLEGSNDSTVSTWTGGNWELIAQITNTAFASRFETHTVLFDNYKPYTHYRWTAVTVFTPNSCCMQVADIELLGTGAPKDVTQPGDAVIASSSNSPGSEGAANAIDNTQAKYLNFDADTDLGSLPTGFIVTPAVGKTAVIGMTIQSANDAPERDPKVVTLEGSNDDTVTTWTGGNWELVVRFDNIPAFANRFETQEFYFPNNKAYKHYRWTVVEVQTVNSCCMQVADVELLAATASNPCGQAQFVLPPVDTPVLSGGSATFIVQLNGPWTLQWLKNDLPIPGAGGLSYTTEAITAANQTNIYACAIVGCQTSAVVHASVFTPSTTKSVGINFVGGGANGAPTAMNSYDTNTGNVMQYDIAGIQLQAYWNNATNATGASADATSMGDLLDSDGNVSTILFDYTTTGTWGAGTGTSTGTERMLNGLVGANGAGETGTFTFNSVPAGSHAILIYAVSPPLQFQNVRFTVTGTTEQSAYVRTMNSDEYKPAPGFYRGSSTDSNAPTVANFVRFDNVQPNGGNIVVTVETLTTYDRETGVNGIQLVLNAPNPGSPPVITTQPQPTVAAEGATARLTVLASGNDLTYQWRKNGRSLPDGGNVSGSMTSNLTVSNFSTNDVAIYSVAVFSPAGSVVSKNASLSISTYSISDSLVGHWKLDETSGLVAANAITGGSAANVTGAASWAAGQIANAFTFDGATHMLADNFTKAKKAIAGSAWVNIASGLTTDMAVFRNAHGALDISGGASRIIGQFELGLVFDVNDSLVKPMTAVGIGPNVARVTGSAAFPTGGWHHMAFTADGAQLRLYVDGQQVNSIDYLADINAPDIPWISFGSRLVIDTNTVPSTIVPDTTAPNYLIGRVDDIGLWTRSLTADEVSKIYAAGQQGQALNTVIITPPTEIRIGTVGVTGGNLTVTWTGGGTLYSAPSLNTGTTWTTTGDSDGSFTAPVGAGNLFFRVQQ